MSRLIDADALRANFPEPKDWRDPEQALMHITGIWAEIDNAPTIEPKRKKGKWIDDKGYVVEMRDGSTIRECWCSECGEWLVASDEYAVKGNFCPNCGADMRGEQDG